MTDNNRNQSILIVGTGAMASLFAARLAAIGRQVTLLGTWQEGLEALQKNGVHLVDEQGEERVYPVEATDDPLLCAGAKQALVLVKSWQTKRAARQLADCLSPNGVALTLQNGLDNYQVLAGSIGEARAALGVTTAGATLLAPGRVRVGGNGKISISAHPRVVGLADLLHAAGFTVEIVNDANALLWGKLVINAAINPLTALLRVPNGELLRRPTARTLMGIAAREAALVAAALGIQLPFPDPILAVEDVARMTESNLSSMLRDVLRDSPTEIDSINGAIIRAGESTGVATPINRLLWELVSAMEVEPEGQPAALKSRSKPNKKRVVSGQRPHHPLNYLGRIE
ncbi:MAG TPA: 2-dehydropantoate 2-reductase [Anaerolineales bacterium]|nr:2-dehydropantoate 2-reductase [Anaerolineales bacterium]